MVGVLQLTIAFHTAQFNGTLNLQAAVANEVAAQGLTTAIKNFLGAGGGTVDNVNGQFTPQSTGVS